MSDKGDGVALTSTVHPLNITEEMKQAGAIALASFDLNNHAAKVYDVVAAIYTAMRYAEPPELSLDDWPSDDSIETVEIEIKE